MTRRDYEAIAAAIRETFAAHTAERDQCITKNAERAEHYHNGARCGLSNVAVAVAKIMAADNPRFDRNRFLRACGVSQ